MKIFQSIFVSKIIRKMGNFSMQNTTIINKNTHISKLDYKIQRKISNQLRSAGLFEDDIQLLMHGKLKDIEDNIDIVEVLA